MNISRIGTTVCPSAFVPDGVYNRGSFWPVEVQNSVARHFQTHKYWVERSAHCTERCDEYGIEYASIANALTGEVIEAYFDSGRLWKVVTRQPSRDMAGTDMCCAVKLTVNGALCVTVWLNNQQDNHETLRYMQYEYQRREEKKPSIRERTRVCETPTAVFERRVFSNAL